MIRKVLLGGTASLRSHLGSFKQLPSNLISTGITANFCAPSVILRVLLYSHLTLKIVCHHVRRPKGSLPGLQAKEPERTEVMLVYWWRNHGWMVMGSSKIISVDADFPWKPTLGRWTIPGSEMGVLSVLSYSDLVAFLQEFISTTKDTSQPEG